MFDDAIAAWRLRTYALKIVFRPINVEPCK